MSPPAPLLSVVIPTFNEVARIEQTLRSADDYLRASGIAAEIIIIDNASSDGTAELVRRLFDGMTGDTALVSEPCRGKGAAVKRGVLQSRGDFVVFLDADNATPLSEMERFWPFLRSGVDVVVGSRYVDPALVAVRQPRSRIVLSRIGNTIIRWLLVSGIHDTQLGFKAFKGDVARDIFSRVVTERWAFDVELLLIARLRGCEIREVGVIWREQGGSHLRWTAYVTALLDVLKVRWRAWRGLYAA